MQGFWEWFVSPAAGIIATWVGGIGTTAAVAVAFWQSRREARKQRAERERAQAETVAAWIAPSKRNPLDVTQAGPTIVEAIRNSMDRGSVISFKNGSQVPIYDVVVLMVPVQGAAPRNGEDMGFENHGTVRRFLVMPPGTYWTELKSPPAGMHIRFGVEVAFRDAAGKAWVRRGNGTLESLNGESPFTGRIEDLAADPDSLYEVADS